MADDAHCLASPFDKNHQRDAARCKPVYEKPGLILLESSGGEGKANNSTERNVTRINTNGGQSTYIIGPS